MNVIAINGSPRKRWNTATLLEHALEGAASQGAETELIHLYDYGYQGCTSCFACKTKDGKSYGRCAVRDEITPIFSRIEAADALILGSPIYYGTMTGMMRSFTERLFFPHMTYTIPSVSLFPKRMKTAFIYTMNVSEPQLKEKGYQYHIGLTEQVMNLIFGESESFFAYETRQFEDYSKVVFSYVDPEERVKKAEQTFPDDCRRAYELGIRLVTP